MIPLLEFNLTPFQKLDEFALIASQDYNLGNTDDWFGYFRGGLYATYVRVNSIPIHYPAVYSSALLPTPFSNTQANLEYHLASIFFNMDSTLECIAFALNALGYAVNKKLFRDITSSTGLRDISPKDISNKPSDNPEKYIEGYDTYLPTIKEHWIAHEDMIQIITDQHDVSKHRKTIFRSGMSESPLAPMSQIYLTLQPKRPRQNRNTQSNEDISLQEVAEGFCDFVNVCGIKALEDAKNKVKLNFNELKR